MARFGQGQSLPKLFSIDVYALEAKSHTVCDLLPEKDNQCVAFSHNEGLLRENGDSVRISPWALFHRILKCHVLIELKPKKFDRADALQLGVYMEYYRKRMMSAGDNPPIGILMCTEVGKELAEYIAPFVDERMFLTKYMLQLPSKETLTGFLKKENEGLPASEGK